MTLTKLETLQKQLAIAKAQKIMCDENYALQSDNFTKRIDELETQISSLSE